MKYLSNISNKVNLVKRWLTQPELDNDLVQLVKNSLKWKDRGDYHIDSIHLTIEMESESRYNDWNSSEKIEECNVTSEVGKPSRAFWSPLKQCIDCHGRTYDNKNHSKQN